MADVQLDLKTPHKSNLSFFGRLVLGIATLAIIGLVVMSVIVNTLVRGIIYNNVIDIAQSDKTIQAKEIDIWLGTASQAVSSLATFLEAMPSEEHFTAIAESFVAKYDFISNVFIGFADGRIITGVGWVAPEGWLATDRPWYITAVTAGEGVIATSKPYLSDIREETTVAMVTWVPGLSGMGASVGATIPITYVIDKISKYPVIPDGYLILIGANDEIIVHPSYGYSPGATSEMHRLRDIPNGDFIMNKIAKGTAMAEFKDTKLGPSHFIATPLGAIGWTLITVIPIKTTQVPVFRNLALIRVAFAVLLLTMFVITVLFVSRITRSMEENRVIKERMQAILDSSPLMCCIFDENCNVLEVNQEAERLFEISDKQVFIDRYFDFFPEYQPDGVPSREKAIAEIRKTFQIGNARHERMYRLRDGTPIPTEEILQRVKIGERYLVIAYTRDLRDFYRFVETTEQMQFLFDAVPLVLTFWDKDFNIVECNQKAVQQFGLSSKEEFKEKFFELSPEFQPDGMPSKKKAIESLQRGFSLGHAKFEWMHQSPDGTEIPSEVFCFRSKYKGEDIVLACARDIRELKESQRREDETNKRIQLIFNTAPILIEHWNKDYKLIDCNQTALNFFEFQSLEKYQERLLDTMPEFQPNGKPSWEQWTQFLEKIFEKGYTRFDFVDKKINGEIVFLEILGVRMEYDNNLMAVTYSNDVTQLKQTLVRMREADERTQLMLGGTPIACYLISKDFEAIDCNNETLHLFGFADKTDGIVKFREIILEHQFDSLKKHFDKALETGTERFEWVLQQPGSKESIPCDIAFTRLTHKGGYVVAAYIFDLRVIKEALRERQRVEVAEESSRAKSRFLARMSHEIRTPLAAILGISEIHLQNPTLTPVTEGAFIKIFNSANTLLGLVNDILDLSKIEAGKMSLMNRKYEVASMISDIVQLHLIYLGSKNIRFRIYVDEQLPTFLIGDELRIKQILGNLLSNAFKYTEAGSVELSLSCQTNGTEVNHITLAIGVRDTGMGMTQKQVDALYDEYARFHEQGKRLEGTGLGMSIVYSLIKMMDGQISVESEEGKGTNIMVYMPQEIASQEVLGKETVRNLQRFGSNTRSTAKKFKFVPEPMPYGSVLVVDDVDTNLYVAKGLLLFYGLKIETCESGYEAIEKVKQGNIYDIIFMDHMMPNMDGLETTKTLREMGYTHPIVALTANALVGQVEEFLRNGFDGFISKPIQTAHLNSTLTKFVRDKQPPEVIEAARSADGIDPVQGNGGIDGYLDKPDVADKLRADFARSQRNVLPDLKRALQAGDVKTAHRLAHTLKGLAAIIKEASLTRAAADLESLLAHGERGEVAMRQLSVLEQELTPVLEGIIEEAKMPNDNTPQPGVAFDKDKTRGLLDRLEVSMSRDSAENLDLAEDLKSIPEAAVWVRLVEDFDFDTALKTLPALREVLKL